MAGDSSFDIISQFDLQELRNALDQVKREVTTRYDFKGVHTEITLNEDDITVITSDTMKLQAIQGMLFQKLVNRKLSPSILDIQEHEPAAGANLRQVYKLIKALDAESCKIITKLIKENFPKVKSTIQGSTVRVSSKSKDELQEVMALLRSKEDLKIPLTFTNYR